MELINGISFRDFACANANIVAGMSLESVCKILGVEQPVWEDTVQKWNHKMAELSMDDMKFYGEVFTNPKQGKFANVEGAAAGADEAVKKIPTLEDFENLFWHQAVAAENGIDLQTLFREEYNMSITEWSQVSMHYSKELQKFLDPNSSNYDANFEYHHQLQNDMENKWKKHYSSENGSLADDIDL